MAVSSRGDAVAVSTAILNASSGLCPSQCSGHGVCQGGACICHVQWTGGECAHANYPYVVTFGTIFTILALVSFAQLALTMYHDSKRNKSDRIRDAFRFTVHKWLYFVAWLACGSRAFSFIMQEDLSSWFALNVQSIYYPFLITLGSLLSCLLGERYYLDIPSSETNSISKSFLFYVGFNVSLWLAFFLMIGLTFAQPVEHLAFIHRIFYLVFAFVLLLSATFFLIYGGLMFYKVTGAFKTEHCRVNSKQLSLSRAGVFFQGVFQLTLVSLLVVDFSSNFFPPGSRFFNRDLFNIVSRVTDIAVVIWFPCALWNCKKPETLWILNPRQVLDVDSGEYAPLSAESQRSYGSTVRRVPANREQTLSTDEFECWICYDAESRKSGPLICPCDCKGATAAVHHNCLKRWLQEQGELSQRKIPQCDICKKAYTVDRTQRFKLTCTTVQGLRTTLLLFIIMALPMTIIIVLKRVAFLDLAKYIIIIIAAVLELVCLRLLGVTCDSICHRAMMAALTIVGPHPATLQQERDSSGATRSPTGMTRRRDGKSGRQWTTASLSAVAPSSSASASALYENDNSDSMCITDVFDGEPTASAGLLRRTPSPPLETTPHSLVLSSGAGGMTSMAAASLDSSSLHTSIQSAGHDTHNRATMPTGAGRSALMFSVRPVGAC